MRSVVVECRLPTGGAEVAPKDAQVLVAHTV